MLKNILKQFGLPASSFADRSIWPHSEVYVGHIDGHGKAILKKGILGGPKNAVNLKRWQRDLNSCSDIQVVYPLSLTTENPKTIDDERWIIYPFIQGESFSNTDDQLLEAGRFLGQMHLFNAAVDYEIGGFDPGEFGQDWLSEVRDDMHFLRGLNAEGSAGLSDRLLAGLEVYLGERHDLLMEKQLPLANATWDYKASNILFVDNGIVGIDLENAGRLPRIMDLALALLLFNSDLDSSECPPRVFTPDEWGIFLKGYQDFISFEAIELESWQDMKSFVFADEALWAICEAIKDQASVSSRNQTFMAQLMGADLSAYELE